RRQRHRARHRALGPEVSSPARPRQRPTTMTRAARIHRITPPVLFVLLTLLSATAHAVGTRTFQLDTLDEFKGGDLTGVSVDSSGSVRAGMLLGATPITQATSIWSAAVLPDG